MIIPNSVEELTGWFNLDEVTVEFTLDFELDDAVNESVEGVVLAHADVFARVELGAALANNDAACVDGCIAENLDAEALSLGIATVAGRAAAFLVCHF